MPRLDPKFVKNRLIYLGYEPLEEFTYASAKLKCKCLECKNIIDIVYADVNRGRKGCKYCFDYDIKPKNPKKIMLKANLQPLEPYKNSKSNWKCKCLKCGKTVSPTFHAVKQQGSGCKYCSGNAVDAEDAVKFFLKNKLQPLESYKNSEHKWKSKCMKCEEIVYPRYAGVYSGQGGCVFCGKGGLDYSKPSFFYIIYNHQMNAIKVGISNLDAKTDRMKAFKMNGWQIHKKYDFATGVDAVRLEADIKRWLRKELKIPIFLSKKQMPKTGGHSETISSDYLTVLQINQKVIELIKGYRNNP